jgi:hypothetical protein
VLAAQRKTTAATMIEFLQKLPPGTLLDLSDDK